MSNIRWGESRIVFIAHQREVESKLAMGWSRRKIYEEVFKGMPITYYRVCSYIRKLCQPQKPKREPISIEPPEPFTPPPAPEYEFTPPPESEPLVAKSGYPRVRLPDLSCSPKSGKWKMNTEQSLLKKYRHDFWGHEGDNFLRGESLKEIIDCYVDVDEPGMDFKIIVSGGDAGPHHISDVIQDTDDAIEWLDDIVHSKSIKKACCVIDEMIEERYAECVMEVDTSETYAYMLPFKLSTSLKRIFYREAKRYNAAFESGDDASLKPIANTLLRRYRRAVRHLPVQRWGRLNNWHEYEVTIKNSHLVKIERIDREEAAK